VISKGTIIGDRYEIIKSLGEGGMANVYLANDILLNREVAIKMLRGELSNEDKFIKRFQREALALSSSSISHPNIVQMYDLGEENNNHYIVQERSFICTAKTVSRKAKSLCAPPFALQMRYSSATPQRYQTYIVSALC